MGRNYKKEGQIGNWNEKDMVTAIQALKIARMTVYGAAKHSRIPSERYEVV